MDFITIIGLALKISIILTEFSLGLKALPEESLYLLRRPALLVRSILAMYVIVPLFVVGIAAAFQLDRPVKIALVALALSPIPPLLPIKQMKAGGSRAYITSLFVVAALLSLVFVPFALSWLDEIFALELHIDPFILARLVLLIIIVPLAAGMVARHWLPRVAERIASPLNRFSLGLLVISALPVAIYMGSRMLSLTGNGAILAFIAFALIGMSAGHFLGGPIPENRVVLSLAAASRHPGMALVIAVANFPEKKMEVLAALLLYLIVSSLVSLPWVLGRGQKSLAP